MTENLGFKINIKQPYESALQTLTDSLKIEGFGILTHIDVKQTLKTKLDVDFRPYAILGACNPSLAHRILVRNPEAGLLLPCTITMETEPDGSTSFRIADPEMMLRIGMMEDDEELIKISREVREKLLRVVSNLSKI